jgi:hypothetical protein
VSGTSHSLPVSSVSHFSATLNDAFGWNVLWEISQARRKGLHRQLKLKSGGEFRIPEPIGLGRFDCAKGPPTQKVRA